MSLKVLIQRLIALSIGLVYAAIVIVVTAVLNIRHPINFFLKKKRDVPPACLTDKSLGEHCYIHLEDVKLHYVASGQEGQPLMLFVHGFPEFWYSWRHQIKEFSKDYRVVAIDQRGYSDSDKPSDVESYSRVKLISDLKQLIPALGYRSCILVGHDWGGVVCWLLAALHPELIDKLIIMNIPHPTAFMKHFQSSITQFMMSWYVFFFQVPYIPELLISANDWDAFSQLGIKNMTDEDIEAYKYAASRPGALTAAINYYRCSFRFPRDEKLPKIQKPTLLIWGTNDVALHKVMAAMSSEYVEDFTLEYMEGASHFVQMDMPDEVNKCMKSFLEAKKT